ncbi:hypothetical protein OIU79_030301 [Salix purpurea]|uniref:Pentatricopeptide repeat-containing protein n=1 Tax=Salix purpurea TaxID=77065 RepID=A0A9Q0VAD7_SALPP|nr:hypothetical protein OIU79_030301 [Salix purpurea]
MNDREMVPDEVTIGIVVQMYKKAGKFQKAEEFFKKWTLGGGSLKKHLRLLQRSLEKEMEELRCRWTQGTYNILIFLHTKHNNITMAASYSKKDEGG